MLMTGLLTAFACVFLASNSVGVELKELIASEGEPFEEITRVRQPNTKFSGQFEEHYSAPGEHKDRFETLEELSKELSYETAWTSTGKRKLTLIRVHLKNTTHAEQGRNTSQSESEPFPADTEDDVPSILRRRRLNRKRRELFGRHRRYYIPTKSFAQRYPFEVVVKVSTGCTGTLVSPRHVLTAAHCLHDGKDYTKGFRSLKVGLLQPNKTFEWIHATQTKLPLAWVQGRDLDASRYDYAIIKLTHRHKRRYMHVTYSEGVRYGRRAKIHFTAFEDDRPLNTMWYRSCYILTATSDLFYHCCDAQPGSSGAGIYVYHVHPVTGVRDRRIIGVFSGNRNVPYHPWWPYVGCPPIWRGNFNAGIRLNSLKFQQICSWIGLKHAGEDCRRFLEKESARAREPTAAERGRGERNGGGSKRKGRAAKKRERNRLQRHKKRKRTKKQQP